MISINQTSGKLKQRIQIDGIKNDNQYHAPSADLVQGRMNGLIEKEDGP